MNLPHPDETLEVEPLEIKQLLDRTDAGFRLIDCREEDEFALCRIEGAELVPLSTFAEQAPALFGGEGAASTPVVVYCHHGMRSLQAVQFLRSLGVRPAFSMRGGIDRWATEVDSSVGRY